MAWKKLIISDPKLENFENLKSNFEVHVREPWKTRFYVTRSLFLIIIVSIRKPVHVYYIPFLTAKLCSLSLHASRISCSTCVIMISKYDLNIWNRPCKEPVHQALVETYRCPFQLSNIFHSLLLLLLMLLDWNWDLVLQDYKWVPPWIPCEAFGHYSNHPIVINGNKIDMLYLKRIVISELNLYWPYINLKSFISIPREPRPEISDVQHIGSLRDLSGNITMGFWLWIEKMID